MSINSVRFLIFVLVSVIIYYLIPKKVRWVLLLAISVLFYLTYGIRAALFLLLTVCITYAFAILLTKMNGYKPAADSKEERKRLRQRNNKRKKLVLACALVLNFSCLIVLKYSGFLVSCVNNLLSAGFPLPQFLLPLGISFYIFQTSAYLIDIYRGKYEAVRNPARYALFVCFFPQMIQGPINRFDQIGPQLFDGNDFSWENMQHGLLRILYGVLKKALVADTLAPIVSEIYGNYSAYPGAVSFLGALLYCLQLYCDFSGGIDFMMGISRLFGIRMQENFCRPYLSVNLSDFWRRWHISLGEWMKDYLFYPLAVSKPMMRLSRAVRSRLPEELGKRIAPSIATFLVFLAVGMWQGPGFQNIAYGLWNGFWMSLALFWAPVSARLDGKLHFSSHKRLMTAFGVLRTDLLVTIGRFFSNADSLHQATGMLKRTFTAPGFSQLSGAMMKSLGFTVPVLIKVLPALAVILFISLRQERGTDVAQWICSRKWYVQLLILFLAFFLATVRIYGNANYTPIAYVYESV